MALDGTKKTLKTHFIALFAVALAAVADLWMPFNLFSINRTATLLALVAVAAFLAVVSMPLRALSLWALECAGLRPDRDFHVVFGSLFSSSVAMLIFSLAMLPTPPSGVGGMWFGVAFTAWVLVDFTRAVAALSSCLDAWSSRVMDTHSDEDPS